MPRRKTIVKTTRSGYQYRVPGYNMFKKRSKKTEAQKKTTIVRSPLERPVAISAVPHSIRRKMMFSQFGSAQSSLGIKDFYTFNINSIYQHQPMGYDQYSYLYTKYVVHNAKIEVTAMNEVTGKPVLVGIRLDDDTTATATTIDAAYQQDYPYVRLLTANTNGQVKLSRTWSAKKAFTVKDVHDNHSIIADYGANPSYLNYAKVYFWTPNALTSADICFNVVITFDVEIFDPKELNSS